MAHGLSGDTVRLKLDRSGREAGLRQEKVSKVNLQENKEQQGGNAGNKRAASLQSDQLDQAHLQTQCNSPADV